jgi:site-specific DNA-cytosine methylase
MKVLIACEYSGVVTEAFRARGHEAYSVDLLNTTGNERWHFVDDVRNYLKESWDLVIGFPPCTDLSAIGARYWPEKQADGRQQASFQLVQDIYNANSPKIAIENPIGWMNTNWRKPDQIIQPWMFGDPWKKATCLWLKDLPLLVPTDIVEPQGSWVDGGTYTKRLRGQREGAKMAVGSSVSMADRTRSRNKTFQGIANAMAEQWGIF